MSTNPFIHIDKEINAQSLPYYDIPIHKYRAKILVDDWIPNAEDEIFRHTKGAIMLPVSEFYNMKPDINFDSYVLSPKRCYNSDEVRAHCCKYLNYFEKFYDIDHELLSIYYYLKYMIDCEPRDSKDIFFADLKRYILGNSILIKARNMNIDNYSLNLTYKNRSNPGLQYTDKHGAILMEISLLMNMCMPLLTHYLFRNKIQTVKDFLLEAYDMIFDLYPDVDIYNKLYETAASNINHNATKNSLLWSMQGIRSINTTTHSLATVENIILQIMIKYLYKSNIVCFNYESIMRNIRYQVVEIAYEYSFVSLSSSKREGEDSGSQFDKDGNYNNWWTEDDTAAFQKKAQKLIDYYNGITAFGNEKVNGSIVQGEAVADIAGLKAMLLLASKEEDFNYKLFFESYANMWKEICTYEADYSQLTQNPHPLYYLRVNVVVQQFDEFYEAFDVKEGDGMYLAPEDRISVW